MRLHSFMYRYYVTSHSASGSASLELGGRHSTHSSTYPSYTSGVHYRPSFCRLGVGVVGVGLRDSGRFDE